MYAMSYSVKLTDEVVRKLSGWRPSSHHIREILKGLDSLAYNPSQRLIRVLPPHDTLQFDLIVTAAEGPRHETLYTFTVRYGADEETLFILDCELLVEDEPPT
jgi:hypothetical protein